MPQNVFVSREEIRILTFTWLTKVNIKDVNIFLVTHALNTSLLAVFRDDSNKELFKTTADFSSVTVSESTMIYR